jgi:hypothetical protein
MATKRRFTWSRITVYGAAVLVVLGVVLGGLWLLSQRGKAKDAAAVAALLKELNPGFDGPVTWEKDDNGAVIKMEFSADHVSDISPLRVLTRLQELSCSGTGNYTGKISDLGPLHGLPLRKLTLNNNSNITDLSPLKGMPLESLSLWQWGGGNISHLKGLRLKYLNCGAAQVTDLSPLAGMPLEGLVVNFSGVTDLEPLRGMPLKTLGLRANPVKDLSPLRGMELTELNIAETPVTDLEPLRGMPLVDLVCEPNVASDSPVVRTFAKLRKLNGEPPKSDGPR